MTWPPYPDYKSSHLPWIGDVPAHWNLAPNRALLDLRREPVGKKSGEYPLLSLTLRGVILRDVSENKGKFPAEFDTYQAVDPGNLVFCLFDIEETPRTVGLAQHRGMVTGAYDVFRVRSGVEGRYVEYLYRALDEKKSLSYFYSGLRKVIRMPTFKGIRSPVPPLPEQVDIADFLDVETAKIDALIGKQEQLIATLREDRTATITHAVTKGLHFDVDMRDSGVQWLGAQPVSWSQQKLGRLFSFLNGDRGANYPSSEEMIDEGVPFINAGHLRDGQVDFSSMNYITEDKYTAMGGAKLRGGDLLYCLRGSLGKNALIGSLPNGGALASSLVALRTRDESRVDQRFAFFLMNSALEQTQRTVISSGSAQPNLAVDDVARFVFGIPPVAEQRDIVEFLHARCVQVDALIAKATEVVETLREYRSALITDAVTGKIDVRRAA